MSIDLSIVSGTYNRIGLLKNLVNSIRNCLKNDANLYGLNYEIVLVDGGSTDGTLQWCRQQSDIFLIEHGELRGAVKAFNDGAFAAKGRYVILANDDVEFIGDTLLTALIYMENNPDCGIGCFYQDRGRHHEPDHIKWHVESMPVVRDGKQSSGPYGQVCIVPKWLGDKVGWWGNYLHTYGGDNELSSRVYELGYKVSPIPGAKIHDTEIMDELRKKNNINGAKDPRAIRGHHPDSWAWGKRWRNERANLVGPVVKYQLQCTPEISSKERIVYLPIYEKGWEHIQKQQKYGLRQALEKIGFVYEIDYVDLAVQSKALMLSKIREACLKYDPTILLTQIHNIGQVTLEDIHALKRSLNTNAVFVNWNGDFWPQNLLSPEGLLLARTVDLQLVLNREVLDEYKRQGINADYWQIGVEPEGFDCGNYPIMHDVVFLANHYSNARRRLVEFLRQLGLNFGLYGQGWPSGWSGGQTLYNFKAGCQLYRASKISIGDSQWPDTGFVSNRLMQALGAGGAALAHQWFRDCDQLGLRDGETCILWRTKEELRDKIHYYLSHEEERAKIALAGEILAKERHSFEHRVKELMSFLGREKQRKLEVEELDWR